jgi:alkylation response protein AidB-like acyl-CoA dehydrogenase
MTIATALSTSQWPADRQKRRDFALAQIDSIRDRIEAGVAAGQQEGRVTNDVIDALRDAGILGIMTPDDLGGNVVDPVTAFEIVEALGRIDPSTAWTSTILLEGAGQLATQLSEEDAQSVFAGRLPLKAGSLRPGEATRAAGGYIINGKWDFVSGVHHADFVSATFLLEVNGKTERRAALIPTSKIEILDSWHVLGMKATGSTSFTVSDVFVPDSMIYDPMGKASRTDTPLARLTMVPYVLQMHPGMVLGAARRALDEIMRIAPGKRRGSRINLSATSTLAESSWFQRELGALDAKVLSARALVIETLERLREHIATGEPVTLELLDAMQTASSHAGVTAQEVITRAFRHAGAEAIVESHVLARLLRDINTVLAHGVLGEIGFELHAEFILGLQTPENRRMI